MDEPRIRGIDLFLGFLIGLGIGVGCFVMTLVLAMNIPGMGGWPFPVLNGAALMVAGYFAARNFNESGMARARGVVIALSLVFLLNGICGVSLARRW